ncbi:MAG: hypothetical protein H0T79_21485 [Deltaproteobacteria bacterium]|nr:hypothetical protein [Deltaproteobacteria bacterium]
MELDRGPSPRVAWLSAFAVALVGCGPTFNVAGPPPEPGPVAKTQLPPRPTTNGRHVIVGEMCPQGAGGRPAVAPLVMRGVQWTDNPKEIGYTVERGSTPRFVVFGIDGKPAGVFDTIGLADIGLSQPIASGAYVGAGPCSADAGNAQRVDDPRCLATLGGCGIAVSELARPDDPPETPVLQTGTACLAGDTLAVDIDADGAFEAFPIGQVLDGIRGPTAEWTAAPAQAAPCTGSFQLYDVRLDRKPDAGKAADPKSTVMLDVLAVVDLDGDSRKELILALRFPTVRSIVVYSPLESAQRLELVGEGTSFPR